MKITAASVQKAFRKRFKTSPGVVATANGRAEIYGNHVDYHQGHCVSMAINRGVTVALSLTDDQQFTIVDLGTGQEYSGPLTESGNSADWFEYVLSVVRQFNQQMPLINGLRAVFQSSLPIGSGLSSSAALEMAFGEAFRIATGLVSDLKPMDLAVMCREAENQIGVPCGLLDQATVGCSVANRLIHLNCAANTAEPVEAEGFSIVIAHCGQSHKLGEAYIKLVQGGLVALAAVNANGGAYRSLAAVAKGQLPGRARAKVEELSAELGTAAPAEVSQVLFRWLGKDRALSAALDKVAGRLAGKLVPHSPAKCLRHVVNEERRTRRFIGLLMKNRGKRLSRKTLSQLGRLMNASHNSTKRNLGVSGPALDQLAGHLRNTPHVYGARLSGGGLGGCCIALVEPGHESSVLASVRRYYRQNRIEISGKLPPHFATRPSAGAGGKLLRVT